MGKILEIMKDPLRLDRYRRVRLMLDVKKPLTRFRDLKDKHEKVFRLDFDCIREIPFFVFYVQSYWSRRKGLLCGPEEEKKKGLEWGIFLKASPRKGMGREVEDLAKHYLLQGCSFYY